MVLHASIRKILYIVQKPNSVIIVLFFNNIKKKKKKTRFPQLAIDFVIWMANVTDRLLSFSVS